MTFKKLLVGDFFILQRRSKVFVAGTLIKKIEINGVHSMLGSTLVYNEIGPDDPVIRIVFDKELLEQVISVEQVISAG